MERLYRNPVVVIDFKPDSTMSQALDKNTDDLMAVAQNFAAGAHKDTGIPVSAQWPQPLTLVVDMNTVTTDLLQRFRQRPDVEYAQPNVMMQPYGGDIVKPVQ